MAKDKPEITACSLTIDGLDCPDCAAKVEKAIAKMPGVERAAIAFGDSRLNVEFREDAISKDAIGNRIEEMGYALRKGSTADDGACGAATVARLDLKIIGMDCPDCASKIEKTLEKVPGVEYVSVDFADSKFHVDFKPGSLSADEIRDKITALGYKIGNGVSTAAGSSLAGRRKSLLSLLPVFSPRAVLILTILSGVFAGLGFLSPLLGFAGLSTALYVAAILFGAPPIARKALGSLVTLSADINLLMTVAVIGAGILGDWAEGASVVFLFSLAGVLENYSLEKSRTGIRSLVKALPRKVLVENNGVEGEKDIGNISPGEIMIIKPGQVIPLDGTIIAGTSSVNQAAITGESVPVLKEENADVFAGTVNGEGALKVRVTAVEADTTLARIIHLVEEARSQKSPTQGFMERFSRVYTPTVIILAFLVMVVPPLLFNEPFSTWFYRALVLLVISCPCALVISTPVSITSALARGARNGLLFKGGVHLENLGRLKAMAFDKTGTLTEGKPEVIEIISLSNKTESEILEMAAGVEAHSEHPFASAILKKAEELSLEFSPADQLTGSAGKGATGRINGDTVMVGKLSFLENAGPTDRQGLSEAHELTRRFRTVVFVGNKTDIYGGVVIEDKIRPQAGEAISLLHREGVFPIALLSGDAALSAGRVGDELNIDETYAELLPQDKVALVKELAARYRTIAMVGDGVNDAPALASATVGIAMGVAGTGAAIETADVALMGDNLLAIPFAVALGRKTLSTIRSNVIFAALIKLVFLVLAVSGLATLWMAVFADMGASLIVISNSLLILTMKFKTGHSPVS